MVRADALRSFEVMSLRKAKARSEISIGANPVAATKIMSVFGEVSRE
jgi:hypothetical protein